MTEDELSRRRTEEGGARRMANMRPLFVAIEGPIGVGKSTLVRTLADITGWDAMFEPVEANPYLDHFYGRAEGVAMEEGMRRWTFPMQIHLLHARYILHQRARVSPNGTLQDRSIYGDTVFARDHHRTGLMSDLEWGTYRLAWEAMRQHLVLPDMFIFLDAPVEVLQGRIAERGRMAESGIPDAYLEGLRDGYAELEQEMRGHTPCYRFDWTDPDASVRRAIRAVEVVAQDDGFTWARRRPTLLPPERG